MGPHLDNLLVERVDKEHHIYKGPEQLFVDMPVGDSDKLEQVQLQTIGITVLGMLVLLREVYVKSGEKVHQDSNFNDEGGEEIESEGKKVEEGKGRERKDKIE